jgi:hypothetical protein
MIFSMAMGIGNSDPTTRRTFLTALSAASYTRIAGANDRVQVGFIGYGLIGSEHVRDFKKQPDADLAALSDVYQPRLEQGVAACGGRAKPYSDSYSMTKIFRPWSSRRRITGTR